MNLLPGKYAYSFSLTGMLEAVVCRFIIWT